MNNVALLSTEALLELSRRINRAQNPHEMLIAAGSVAIEAGAGAVGLYYNDYTNAKNPAWLEAVAIWRASQELGLIEVGTRFYHNEFPATRLMLDNPEGVVMVEDVENDPLLDENMRRIFLFLNTYSVVVIPFMQHGEWIGVLLINWFWKAHQFTEHERAMYHAVSLLAAPAIAHMRIHFAEQYQQHRRLYKLARRLLRNPHPQDIIEAFDKQPRKHNVYEINLIYFDLNKNDYPKTVEVIAAWNQEGKPRRSQGTTEKITDFPEAELLGDKMQVYFFTSLRDSRLSKVLQNYYEKHDFYASVVIPLKTDTWQGLLGFYWNVGHEWGAEEKVWYEGVGELVAAWLAFYRRTRKD